MSRLGWLLIALVVAAGAVSMHAYYRLERTAPPPHFESAQDHFLYGSIGTEKERGVPYWIWLVLPRIFPEYLPGPGGYASIGLVTHEGAQMPIGLSRVDIGVPRVGVNCAFCHTATVRAAPGERPVFYPGAPAHQAGPEEYRRFLAAAAADARFTASTILAEISRNVQLSLPDRLLYRFVLIPETRRALQQLAGDRQPRHPDWGRGRADILGRAADLAGQDRDDAFAAADPLPLWHLKPRESHGYFWDRSNTSLLEVVRAQALVEGASTRWMDTDTAMWNRPDGGQPSALRRVFDYVADLQPPRYPFSVDANLAAAGATIYAATCSQCHDANGARANTPISIDELGTDRRRLDAWTAASAAALNDFGEGHDWTFGSFRKSADGYVAPPLDGVWVTAPYLHNGSVPTLRDLLEPPANRPTRFWRGYDVYDQATLGFISTTADAQRAGTLFDVTQPGNANGGHTYGTSLAADDKRALLEYLKTR